jgi:molecular chaperone GrpE (heat shock protein)
MEEENKPKRAMNPKSLENLRKFTPESAKLAQRKGADTKLLKREIQKEFKKNAKAVSKVIADVPELSSLDVIRMCIHMALQENNYEDAARWAKELAEYEKPKLQRIEQKITTKTEMTDDELLLALRNEGIDPSQLSNLH